jgi:predicted DsbA family dithiol-disulfide isomerase
MKVEIWSDVLCPFCYIGKRKFEQALENFPKRAELEIEWRSFQLAPNLKTDPTKNIHQYLAEHKQIQLETAKKLNDNVTEMAEKVGLAYNFNIAIVANSFLAHCFLHFAKLKKMQNEAEEAMFKAYFTLGKNIDDLETIKNIGMEIGLDAAEIQNTLQSKQFEEEVLADIDEAQSIGVTGVPFFVFDRKYAVSGAQDSSVFLSVLNRTFGIAE